MSDTDSGDNKGGRRTPGRGGSTVRGSVRQSFSHGRSHAVVVEKKKKRVVSAPDGAKSAGSGTLTLKRPPRPAPEAAPAPEPEKKGEAAKAPGRAPGSATGSAPAKTPAKDTGEATAKDAGKKSGQILRTLSDEEYARRLEALKQARKDEEARRQREAEEARRRAEQEAKRRAEEEARRLAEEAEAAQRRQEAGEAAEAEAAETGAAETGADTAADTAEEAESAGQAPEAAPEKAAEKPAEKPAETAPEPARPAARASETQAEEAPARGRGPAKAPKKDKAAPARPKGEEERRRAGKLTISKLGEDEGGRQRSLAAFRRRQEREKRKTAGGPAEREKVVRDVRIPDAITVQELANRMAERVADVIKALMKNGVMATQNQSIDADTAELIVEEFGHKPSRVSEADVEAVIETGDTDRPEELAPRAPVVTVMGHVDHGKTSVLDALRKTSVVSGEAGGITQHIGAYQIATEDGRRITFLDTPGHAAFSSMRARGAQVTDIVVLVVAADDSVMPQTVEAINHARAAGVPMIVAINKIDRPGADPDKVRTGLLHHEVVVEEMGGEVLTVECSAVTGEGLDTLIEAIALQAELMELKANPNRPAEGAVIEAKLDVGRGPVATVLVQRGTLRLGDIFVVGEHWGRVRALVDDQGQRVREAGPAIPVEVLGLQGTPEAGDTLNVVEDETKAREIAEYRQRKAREAQAAKGARATLDQLLAQAKAGEDVRELPVVIKADVQGSTEAIVQALEKVGNEEVQVRVLHSGVGAITESDVTLAEASRAPIIGFNVRANAPAREAANQKGVEIRYYSVIYDLVDDVKKAAEGLLSPEVREKFVGHARIKQVFKVSGVGRVAGCEVTDGVARRAAGVRLLRDDVVVHEGKLKTLKRFKDEVREVQAGQECGMAFENYEDIREGDVIEIFEREEVERTL